MTRADSPLNTGGTSDRGREKMGVEECGYPRVLIIAKSPISERDSTGASLGKWFGQWPKKQMAYLYSALTCEGPDFCPEMYRFGGGERRLGGLFERLRRSELASSAGRAAASPVQAAGRASERDSTLRTRMGRLLVESGLWEVMFSPRLSQALLSWVTSFRPEVIYAQIPDLTFLRIPVLLHRQLGIPVCMQVSDDWPGQMYRRSVARFAMRPLVTREFHELTRVASAHLGVSQTMEREYRRRYGVHFEPLMLCDSGERFRRAKPQRIVGDDVFSFVYCGNLGHDRWRALRDAARAVQELSVSGVKAHVSAFVSHLPVEAMSALDRMPALTFHPAPRDAEVPAVLKGADALLLLEGFSQESQAYARLSLSSKAHLYMMSERPTLVYGPAGLGVVEYAQGEQWGLVVDQDDGAALQNALRRFVLDAALRDRLVARGRAVAAANHEESVVREHLRRILAAAARTACRA